MAARPGSSRPAASSAVYVSLATSGASRSPIGHVLVTAAGPRYAPLLEMDADQVRDLLSDHVVLGIAPVRVNLIAAGFVDTPLSASLLGDKLEERRDELRRTLPIGRVVSPADVAALAVHLMANTALTGATYDIDGGQQFVS